MANGASDDLINKVINHVVGGTAYTQPVSLTLHLYNGDPHGAGTEVSDTVDDTAYAAQTITFENEGTTTNNRSYNDLAATFAAVVYGSGGAAYNVTHWAVKDNLSNLVWAGTLPNDVTISRVTGEPLVFAVGSIYFEMTRTA